MGHLINSKVDIYKALADRLHKNPVGTPVNDDLIELLYRIYTEGEAVIGSKFPFKPASLEEISTAAGIDPDKLQRSLKDMIAKGLVIAVSSNEQHYYWLSPMVIGFYEFLFMRVRDDLDLKEIAHLFDRYFQHFEVGLELFGGETKFMRALIYEKVLPAIVETEVLEYERAVDVIKNSGGGAIGLCACRHKAIHLNDPCKINAPLDVCISLGEVGSYMIENFAAKPASINELLGVLEKTEKLGLVHLCDNVLLEPAFICNCCGCCCGLLHVTREYGFKTAHPSNFIASVKEDHCDGCAECADKCQVSAISMTENQEGVKVARIDLQRCLGCGICSYNCAVEAIDMLRRQDIHEPTENKNELYMQFARERGKQLELDPSIKML
ncbi:MAG: 4Fe-4S dicluster domain-containing protein [Bacillota bacterium]|nr:4Fe-4S dicluster domain-containing protein [Bacillota bacterium]